MNFSKLLLVLFLLAAAPVVLAQVPDVQGRCVSGCGGSTSGSSVHHETLKERDRRIDRIQFYDHYRKYHESFMREVNRLRGVAKKAMKEHQFAQALSYLSQANAELEKDRNNSRLYKPTTTSFTTIPLSAFTHIDNEREANQARVNQEIAEVNKAQTDILQAQQRQQEQQRQAVLAEQQRQAQLKLAAQSRQNADPSADNRGHFVTNSNGTAMQQLQSAAGDNAQAVVPTVNAACVAQQRGSGNWGACGLPASLMANKEAMKNFEKMANEWRKKKDEEDKLNEKMSNMKTEMNNNPDNVELRVKLVKEYSEVSNKELLVHSEEAQINDQMNSFLVQFEEEDKAAPKKSIP